MKSIIYKVKKGDTLDSISKIFGVDSYMIFPQEIEVGDRVIVNIVKTKYHIVMPGDTFDKLSQKYNISVEKLKEDNRGNLFIGRQVVIN
jgi:LysM repeat protein